MTIEEFDFRNRLETGNRDAPCRDCGTTGESRHLRQPFAPAYHLPRRTGDGRGEEEWDR